METERRQRSHPARGFWTTKTPYPKHQSVKLYPVQPVFKTFLGKIRMCAPCPGFSSLLPNPEQTGKSLASAPVSQKVDSADLFTGFRRLCNPTSEPGARTFAVRSPLLVDS